MKFAGVCALTLALLAQPATAAAVLDDGAAGDAAGADHAADEGHGDREGDTALFMELFGHLEPHAVTGIWFGGDKGFAVVKPHALDSHGEVVLDSHGQPAVHPCSSEFTEAYTEQFGGGQGYLIYNINTVQWLAVLVLLMAFLPVAAKARRRSGQGPQGKLYGLMESLVLFVRDEMVYPVMGRETGRRFVPFFLSMFFFILFMNILGLLPIKVIGGTATANLAVTGGLALTTLLCIHVSGIRQHGFAAHWKNFIPHGLPWWVLPIIVPVEIMGMLVKPLALTIRLFANLTAGHLIVLALFGLVYFFNSAVIALPVMGMAIGIYCLELFVCFVQAYIFTYLSIVFVGSSVHPDH